MRAECDVVVHKFQVGEPRQQMFWPENKFSTKANVHMEIETEKQADIF